MGEVLFYHLTQTPLERTLPELLERSVARDWRVVVRSGAAERLAALDTHLWTYREDSFLAHGTAEMGHAAAQPIYLTAGEEVPNAADILMLVDGARLRTEEVESFTRVVLLFDGHDEGIVGAARDDWRAVTASGAMATYWAQEDGRWIKRAESKPD
ncbi:MAG: DNA polymerase III subunit chi [Pseudomonadota bacterium]